MPAQLHKTRLLYLLAALFSLGALASLRHSRHGLLRKVEPPKIPGRFNRNLSLRHEFESQEMLGGRPLQQMEADHGMLCGRLILRTHKQQNPSRRSEGFSFVGPDTAKSTDAF